MSYEYTEDGTLHSSSCLDLQQCSDSSENSGRQNVLRTNHNLNISIIEFPSVSHVEEIIYNDKGSSVKNNRCTLSSSKTTSTLLTSDAVNNTPYIGGYDKIRIEEGNGQPFAIMAYSQLDAILPLSHSASLTKNEYSSEAMLSKNKTEKLDSAANKVEEIRRTPKVSRWMIFMMLVAILSLTGCLIPAIYFSIRGSELSFWNHFNALSPYAKVDMAKKLLTRNHQHGTIGVAGIEANNTGFLKGLSYSPSVVQIEACVYTLEQALKDMTMLSRVTNSLRTYGTECNFINIIIEAIDLLDLDMKITLGVWLSKDEKANEARIRETKTLLRNSHPRYFENILMGNEVLFREDLSEERLIECIKDMQMFLKSIGIAVPVGTSEIRSRITPELIAESQVVGINVHPFLTELDPREASRWVVDTLYPDLNIFSGFNTTLIISEIGWPYYEDTPSGAFAAQEFMNAWVCEDSPKLNVHWFYFEAFDQPLVKRVFSGHRKQWVADWGVFAADGKPKKNTVVPNCNLQR